jgi:hypothetical protein
VGLKVLVGMNIEYGKVCMSYLRRVLADCKVFVILENDLCWKSQSWETRTKELNGSPQLLERIRSFEVDQLKLWRSCNTQRVELPELTFIRVKFRHHLPGSPHEVENLAANSSIPPFARKLLASQRIEGLVLHLGETGPGRKGENIDAKSAVLPLGRIRSIDKLAA